MRGVRPFTVKEARAAGMTSSELRSATYLALARGSRIERRAVPDGVTRHVRLQAIDGLLRGDQFFSHTTAAAIHGMPLPGRLSDAPIHVASPSVAPRMRRPGVVGHRIKADVIELGGFRVECVIDTIIHLATVLTFAELVAVIDWAVSTRRADPITTAALRARLEHFTGARGLPRLRRAMLASRVGSESPGETDLRLVLRDAGLPEPELNVDVFDAQGTFVARVDIAWPGWRIAVEYDGEQHRLDDRQFAHDIDRLAALERLGWIVIRVTKVHMRDPRALVIPRVREALQRRGALAA